MDRLRVDFAGVKERAGEAVWQELPFGVMLKLRPLMGLTAAAIEGQLSADLAAIAAGEDVIGRYGYDAADVGLLADRQVSNGWARMHMACVRGAALIEDWNLDDPDGQPVEITEANIQQLFNVGPHLGAGSVLLVAFNRLVDAPRIEIAHEKKGSPPSRTGGSAEAESTAPPVAPAEKSALAEAGSADSSAPKSSTHRKPQKAS